MRQIITGLIAALICVGANAQDTMTPDEHFLVGQSPEDSRVWMVAGLSGHGFKFSSVLGESLCQWVCDGESRLSLEVFNPRRFA